MSESYIASETRKLKPVTDLRKNKIGARKGGHILQERSNRLQRLLLVAVLNLLHICLELFQKRVDNTRDPLRSESTELFVLFTGSVEEKLNNKCRKNPVFYQYSPTGYFYISLTLLSFIELIRD